MTTAPKDHPILFSTPMVQAILRSDKPKTQTRRVITGLKPHRYKTRGPSGGWKDQQGNHYYSDLSVQEWFLSHCKYGQPGDQLWVRETWATHPTRRHAEFGYPIFYRADPVNDSHYVWRPSIHMPRWASRITLEITSVRVERLRDISESDAQAEGVSPCPSCGPNNYKWRHSFENLWDDINAKRGFGVSTNPWVWVLEFKRIQP